MYRIFIILIILSCAGCGQHPSGHGLKVTTENAPVQPLRVYDKDGWGGDMQLSVTDISENDSFTFYKAVSSWHGKNLGLSVKVPKHEGEKGFGDGFELKSIGAESDYLLTTLAAVYGQKIDSPAHFSVSLVVPYVNMNSFIKGPGITKNSAGSDKEEYKLFFESKIEQQEAELYLDINREEKWLELQEKDAEYRPMLIKFLKG